MLKVTLSVVALMLIAGCVTSPSANEIRILNREGNVVSGMAGIWWTDKRLKSNPSGVICGGAGEVVANMSITRSDYGGARFTATCAQA